MLADHVLATIRRYALLSAGDRVLVACSGGPDSVALACLMAELAPRVGFTLSGLLHLNHQLRGGDADADERFCREFAFEIGVPIEIERCDVRALARRLRTSIEDAGHRARYEFFDRAATALGADRVAIAHTLDDQAETFLLRLIRGAGPRGLAGISPRRGRLVRPLLDVLRAELIRYLAARGTGFRRDVSNEDIAVPRNRIRHELLPLLRERYSPRINEVLAREAAIARDDEAWLEAAANQASADFVERVEGGLEVRTDALAALPPALGRRVARALLESLAGGRFLAFEHVEALLDVATPAARRAVDLPGVRVTRNGDVLRLRSVPARGAPQAAPSGLMPLSIPGEAHLDGVTVAATRGDDGRGEAPGSSDRVWLDAAAIVEPLHVRTRRPGDRFRPIGLRGRKKLQDFFVDRRVPRERRDRVPLVVDADNRIVWVAGYGVGAEFGVTAGTKAVVILEIRPSGGES
jgi:tRNA(Ile)-lysidine synthase